MLIGLIFVGSYIIIAIIFGSICNYKFDYEYDPDIFGTMWPIGIPFVLVREFLKNKKHNKMHKQYVLDEVLNELKLR